MRVIRDLSGVNDEGFNTPSASVFSGLATFPKGRVIEWWIQGYEAAAEVTLLIFKQEDNIIAPLTDTGGFVIAADVDILAPQLFYAYADSPFKLYPQLAVGEITTGTFMARVVDVG